jgi:hypothetical protein
MPSGRVLNWLRGWDLNPRPSGYEPDELPGCSTPRFCSNRKLALFRERATQFVKFLYGFGHFVRMDKGYVGRRRISVGPGSSGFGEAKRTLNLYSAHLTNPGRAGASPDLGSSHSAAGLT